jgi:hypothetical protein
LASVGSDGLAGVDDLTGADGWVDDEDEVDADLLEEEDGDGATISVSVGTDM